MDFCGNTWNIAHIGEHAVAPADVEYVIQHARRPFPRYDGGGKYRVWGRTANGHYLQVIFVYDPPHVAFVIHVRPLTGHEKRLYRRSQK